MTNMTRRAALTMGGQALLTLGAISPAMAMAFKGESESVSWERFLELCHELSQAQFDDNWDQATYTKKVQKLLPRLSLADEQIQSIIERYENANPAFPEIRGMHYEESFMVSMLEFEPGEKIPLHDHPEMTGVIFCTRGRVDVQHFDRLQDQSESDLALLEHKFDLSMGGGDSAFLTATQGNIHRLESREFTRMIDVFTPPYDRDRVERARYYRMDSTEYQGRSGVYQAETSVQPT